MGRRYDDDGLNVGADPAPALASLVTPTPAFFQRSHAPAPPVDPSAWRLEVSGEVERPRLLSLVDLEREFEPREVTASLVCAGLRRVELEAVRPIPGELPWGADAVSTGVWRGYSLAEVLMSAGLRSEAAHVEAVGFDAVARHGQTFGFGGSIHQAKAMAPEVLLATHLNGAPLPPAHGFPMRLVVPGWIGARSVKWLQRIRVGLHPSENYFQTHAYRILREPDPASPRDVTAGEAMTEIPRNAVIQLPAPAMELPAGRVEVRGWAIGEGCRPLLSVELSVDGGESWRPARILPEGGEWTVRRWVAEVELVAGSHELCVRATDPAGTMPRRLEDSWNAKGYGNNAWHRVVVRVARSLQSPQSGGRREEDG